MSAPGQDATNHIRMNTKTITPPSGRSVVSDRVERSRRSPADCARGAGLRAGRALADPARPGSNGWG